MSTINITMMKIGGIYRYKLDQTLTVLILSKAFDLDVYNVFDLSMNIYYKMGFEDFDEFLFIEMANDLLIQQHKNNS